MLDTISHKHIKGYLTLTLHNLEISVYVNLVFAYANISPQICCGIGPGIFMLFIIDLFAKLNDSKYQK